MDAFPADYQRREGRAIHNVSTQGFSFYSAIYSTFLIDFLADYGL